MGHYVFNNIVDEEDNDSFLDWSINHPSFFLKADSYPEMLANEHLYGASINESCYVDLRENNLIRT